MAEPGARWQATDNIITPHLLKKRMILAGCDRALCLLHYESGGYAHNESIAAFKRTGFSYNLIWNVTGGATYSSLKELEAAIRSGLVKGDWWDRSPEDIPADSRTRAK